MKIRIGFVSNSSSASFVVSKSAITYAEGQILLGYENDDSESWRIYEDGDCIRGSTFMDNHGLSEYLKKRGFPMEKMEWGE